MIIDNIDNDYSSITINILILIYLNMININHEISQKSMWGSFN